MRLTETVVAYDATRNDSPRHVVKRNGPHVALCGDKLQPFGHIRYVEGWNTDRDAAEADCLPCLFVTAKDLFSIFHYSPPPPILKEVNALPDENLDEKIVVMLYSMLGGRTMMTEQRLREEHFPDALIERAKELAPAF